MKDARLAIRRFLVYPASNIFCALKHPPKVPAPGGMPYCDLIYDGLLKKPVTVK
jgi:hypothetical protein